MQQVIVSGITDPAFDRNRIVFKKRTSAQKHISHTLLVTNSPS